jgi:hypothetical protein
MEPSSDHLVLEAYTSEVPGLEQVWSGYGLRLFRVPGSLPRYFTASASVAAGSDDEALQLLVRPDFDVTRTVVLDEGPRGAPAGPAGESGASGTVRVLEERPTRIRLQVERQTSGWLVGLQTYYPGWKARVNGRPGRLLRANVAFSAVPVDAGVSDVVLEYDPPSVKMGLSISAAAASGTIALGLLFLRSRRRPDRNLVDEAERPPETP